MIEYIKEGSLLLGIIIRAEYKSDNIVFFTDDNSSQQLGYMQRPKDYNILPHRHNLVQREVHLTQEVLYIKSGLVRVDFYNNDQHYLESRILKKGDVILLSDGGHGFKMMEQSEIIEVKQGPYCGERDKVRFDPIDEAAIILKDNEQ
ncbi:MAG: hypothetical protein ACK4WD_08430 [Flavobacteriales bacterium]|jgi:cupin superfamily acireductone dioxygenase involved in methionine salvage